MRLEGFCWLATGGDAPLTFWSEWLCAGRVGVGGDEISCVIEVGDGCDEEVGETDDWSRCCFGASAPWTAKLGKAFWWAILTCS